MEDPTTKSPKPGPKWSTACLMFTAIHHLRDWTSEGCQAAKITTAMITTPLRTPTSFLEPAPGSTGCLSGCKRSRRGVELLRISVVVALTWGKPHPTLHQAGIWLKASFSPRLQSASHGGASLPGC